MTHWKKALISFLFLVLMLGFGYLQTLAPEPISNSDIDYAALSLHVEVIADKPHPMGSAANREVRDYIVAYFESLGLKTEIQKTTVVFKLPHRSDKVTIIGNVENIIARLPGTGKGLTSDASDLVLMSHYDSRYDGPGAGDAAANVAGIMEVARIVASEPAPVHDVVFLITDGEEMGLLGAQGYFRQHPLAANSGLVLNFEARGSYGVSTMFETSSNNAWLMEQLIESAPDLAAYSLSHELYKRMPNDTDMSISKGEGIPGLNFAFVAGLADYHTRTDSAENLNKDSLAQQANYILGTTRHFAHLGEWESAEGDKAYFSLWQGNVVSYSETTAIIFGVLVLLFGIVVFFSAIKSSIINWGSVLSGIVSLLILLLIINSIFTSLIGYQHASQNGISRLISLGEGALLAYFVLTLGITAWFAAGIKRGIGTLEIIALVIAVILVSLFAGQTWSVAAGLLLLIPLLVFIRGRKNTPNLWTAGLILWWLLTAALVYMVPNASYFLTWPLASVLLGLVLHRMLIAGWLRDTVFLLSCFVPLLILSPIIILAYLLLGSTMPQGIMIISSLSLILILPLILAIGSALKAKASLVIIIIGLLVTGIVMFDRDFDQRQPLGEELFYAIDVDQQEGFWMSSDTATNTWLANFMGADARADNFQRIMPGYDLQAKIKSTPLPAFNPASLVITAERMVNGQREVSLRLHSPASADYINLLFANDAGITAASVNGFPVPTPNEQLKNTQQTDKVSAMKEKDKTAAENWWRWRWYGLADEGAEIKLTLKPGKPLQVKIIEIDYEMPQGAPQRPLDSMSKPYTWSDSTVIFQTIGF